MAITIEYVRGEMRKTVVITNYILLSMQNFLICQRQMTPCHLLSVISPFDMYWYKFAVWYRFQREVELSLNVTYYMEGGGGGGGL